jgi:glycosyltransferase involved in cell wall biosynthesis
MGYLSWSELPPPPKGKTGWPWTPECELMPEIADIGKHWPLISIVTPSYNQGEYLEATIRSILLQRYPNLEYIIMDGGSTDNSLEIIHKYEPWLAHWETGQDGGQYAAIQKGFSHSTGEIMAWLNSDDMYFPWALRTVAEGFFHLPNVRWLSSKMLCTLNSKTGLLAIDPALGYSKRSFFLQDLKKQPIIIQQESTFWKRDLWQQSGAKLDFELNYAGDFELWARFYKFDNLAIINIPLGIFRYHEKQKTSNLNAYFDEALIVFNRYPRPHAIPPNILYPLLFLLRAFDKSRNWLGVRTHTIQLDNLKNKWFDTYSYKEGIQLLWDNKNSRKE